TRWPRDWSSDVCSSDLITNFKIDARIKPVKELEAKATLSVTARQRTRRVLFFELSRFLRVSEVLADGKPVEFIHNQAVEGSHLEIGRASCRERVETAAV